MIANSREIGSRERRAGRSNDTAASSSSHRSMTGRDNEPVRRRPTPQRRFSSILQAPEELLRRFSSRDENSTAGQALFWLPLLLGVATSICCKRLKGCKINFNACAAKNSHFQNRVRYGHFWLNGKDLLQNMCYHFHLLCLWELKFHFYLIIF